MRKWFFSFICGIVWLLRICNYRTRLQNTDTVIITNLIFFLFSREPRMNLESKWPMIVLEDYSNKKCLRHYMLQIVMQLTNFCSISRCHFNVFSTYLPNSWPYRMAWKPFWSSISLLIRFHKIFFMRSIVYSTH